MRPAGWFTKFGVWFLIAAFLVLPLYELSDYSEVWQHDADLILPGLFFLFSGMFLLTGRRLYKSIRFVIQMFGIPARTGVPVSATAPLLLSADTPALSPPRLSVAFAFSDLRI